MAGEGELKIWGHVHEKESVVAEGRKSLGFSRDKDATTGGADPENARRD